MHQIRQLIREFLLLRLLEKKEKKDDRLLTEPDEPDGLDDSKEEASVVGNIAGVTTPLGTGPTYPTKRKRKIRPKLDKIDDDWYKN